MLANPQSQSIRVDQAETTSVNQNVLKSPRYLFLDGLRGLTALYVLFHHAAAELDTERLRGLALKVALPLRFGHYAVAIFIVLSGFCLALPVALDPEHKLRGGFFQYLARRARRILPPYYAALTFFLAMTALIPVLRTPLTERWSVALPVWTPGVVISHLLLAHNGSPLWAGKIDPPMWSIAVEWQIYLVFPLLLVVWRKAGIGAMVLAALMLGNLDKGISWMAGHEVYNGTCPWYLGLFALGAWAAWMTTRKGEAFPWIVSAAVLLLASSYMLNYHTAKARWNDHLFGLATACCLVAFGRTSGQGGLFPSMVRRLFESRFAIGLGAFSYSLYLIHFPLLSWSHAIMKAQGWGPGLRLALLLSVSAPLCVGIGYLFYLVCERPTIRKAGQAKQARLPHPAIAHSAEPDPLRARGRSVASTARVAAASKGAVVG